MLRIDLTCKGAELRAIVRLHFFIITEHPVFSVKEFACLSVRPSVTNFDPNYDISSNQNQQPIEKKFARLAARAVFVTRFSFKNS